jgi:hypothetical protein
MTEQEWLASNEPDPMLEYLRNRVTDRKLRLFICACCRMIWPVLVGESSFPPSNRPLLLDHQRRAFRNAEVHLETAEHYADRLVEPRSIVTAYVDALGLLLSRRPLEEPWAFALVAVLRATTAGRCFYGRQWEQIPPYDGCQCAVDAADYVLKVADWAGRPSNTPQIEISLIRDIFGNPFRPVKADATWLTPSVVALGQAIYDERAFGRLPELADALVVAGCDDNDILTHCRSDGPHVRGCWVVDLVLGKG